MNEKCPSLIQSELQDAWSRPTAAEERLQEEGSQRPREDLMSRLQREFGLSVEEEEERESANGMPVLLIH